MNEPSGAPPTLPPTAPKEEAVRPHGLLAEFEEHTQLLRAAREAYAQGYRKMDGYSPFPIEELDEALGHQPSRVPLFTLLGGITGALGGYFMEWYSMGRLYPLNVGGRPLNSWPNFIPITFELTILIASLTAVATMFILNGLPCPHHPVFNVPAFQRASIDRFFLCIEATDRRFDRFSTRRFLESLAPQAIHEVTR